MHHAGRMRVWFIALGIITFVLGLSTSFVACGRIKTIDPASAGNPSAVDGQARGQDTAPPFSVSERGELSASYFGQLLTLMHPHQAHFGMVTLKGDEAKILFELMGANSQKTAANSTWVAGRMRQGLDMVCHELAKRETPKILEYTCTTHIDYSLGTVSRLAVNLSPRKKVPHLKKTFTGQNLMVIVGQKKPLALLMFRGQDAEVLYKTLQLKIGLDDAQTKAGKNIVCFKDPEFTCQLHLNYRMGRVLAQKEAR